MRNSRGRGAEFPPDTFHRETTVLTYREKRGKGKKETGEENKEIEKGKVENLKMEGGRRELQNEERDFFFSLFKTTEICLGSTKMEIFYREKYFTPGRNKIRKNDFAPLKIIPLTPLPSV